MYATMIRKSLQEIAVGCIKDVVNQGDACVDKYSECLYVFGEKHCAIGFAAIRLSDGDVDLDEADLKMHSHVVVMNSAATCAGMSLLTGEESSFFGSLQSAHDDSSHLDGQAFLKDFMERAEAAFKHNNVLWPFN